MNWETVIGLEVHVQLATQSKIFSGAATTFGAKPNSQACTIDLGLPGVLPVLNEQAVRMAIKFGLAIDAEISAFCQFDRKNYFYPDLPKGYQISQLDHPIVGKGALDISLADGKYKRINITRAHLEEDAGKSIHTSYPNASGIDLNRAGTPLLEVVSEPELRSAAEAVSYLKTLHTLVRYLDICDGNMQEGSFRCDVNISIRPKGQTTLGTRTEIKNLNSFRFVEKAIHYEVERQIDLLEGGDPIQQETRLYDADKDCTKGMRSKEEANDYRYFPDPDLLPLKIEASMLDEIRQNMPELPSARVTRFIDTLELKKQDAQTLVNSKSLANFFEQTLAHAKSPANLVANWVLGTLSAALNQNSLHCQNSPIGPDALAELLDRISDKTISGKIAKTVFETMWTSKKSADAIIEEQGLRQVTDDALIEKIIDQVIENNPQQVKQYQSGKDKVFGFFVGQVMKASRGKANPAQVNQLLKAKLG